jgi:serine/threonine-protein kinase RsbT
MGSGAGVADEEHLTIDGDEAIIAARQRAREVARGLGFGLVDQSRIATAVSELARNVVRYATDGCGQATIRALPAAPPRGVGLEIVVRDEGPGIADVERALRDGHSTGGGLGLGLPGARRLMDELHLDSGPGRGTVVTIRKWRR